MQITKKVQLTTNDDQWSRGDVVGQVWLKKKKFLFYLFEYYFQDENYAVLVAEGRTGICPRSELKFTALIAYARMISHDQK